jgi:hypothetical protein
MFRTSRCPRDVQNVYTLNEYFIAHVAYRTSKQKLQKLLFLAAREKGNLPNLTIEWEII